MMESKPPSKWGLGSIYCLIACYVWHGVRVWFQMPCVNCLCHKCGRPLPESAGTIRAHMWLQLVYLFVCVRPVESVAMPPAHTVLRCSYPFHGIEGSSDGLVDSVYGYCRVVCEASPSDRCVVCIPPVQMFVQDKDHKSFLAAIRAYSQRNDYSPPWPFLLSRCDLQRFSRPT